MTKTKTILSLLLLSAVCATPASANFFSNSKWNTMLNVGSAPSPTPAQLRAIGDSSYANVPVRRGPTFQSQTVAPPTVDVDEDAYDNGAYDDEDVVGSAYENGAYDEEVVGSVAVVTPTKSAYVTKSTKTVAAHTAITKKTITAKAAAPLKANSLAGMEGKPVFGVKGERLGHVLAVDQKSRKLELQLPTGIAISMPASLVVDKGNRVVAATMTKADTMAMAKSQTGRTTAMNVNIKNYKTRA